MTYLGLLVLLVIVIQSCRTYKFRSNYTNANTLIHETDNMKTKPFLKAHLKNGDIFILTDKWEIDTVTDVVKGYGTQYDFNRKAIYEGEIEIPISNVAIFETNIKLQRTESGRLTALTIMAGVDVLVGVFCLLNPKACFGSCPTFYIYENNSLHYADAEGFTNSISPSMEYFDIDALSNHKTVNNTFSITMKNEALETHCVNEVKMLAYPISKGERVYQSPNNEFFLCENNYSISKATAEEGDITALLASHDFQERFSLSDENNLNSKEEIFLIFDNIKNTENLGLNLNFRQTLMSTYLFYSAMGYMGDKVGDIFAMLETNEKIRDRFDAVSKVLGGIECFVWDEKSNKWIQQEGVNEAGPIAINKQFIPFKNAQSNSQVKVKLRLNKGLWRLDYVSLTNIKKQVTPLELTPTSVYNKGELDNVALTNITSPDKYLISMPGSEYKFNFTLNEEYDNYDFFLYSKGYYLEWMREHWIKDQDLAKLKQMVINPKKHLKQEAQSYKEYESIMEEQFWNSRIDTKTFSYDEN